MTSQEIPIRPVAKPAKLAASSTAILVLDMNRECEEPTVAGYQILGPVATFLERARQHNVPIIYTTSLMNVGTPKADVAPSLHPLADERVLHPDGFDKFTGGELGEALHGAENLVMIGRATNNAIMYTATSAARVHKYQVVMPLDGIAAQRPYEHEYALHQLCAMPQMVIVPIIFSALDQITFE
jgi:nicotinamidase-related amidase